MKVAELMTEHRSKKSEYPTTQGQKDKFQVKAPVVLMATALLFFAGNSVAEVIATKPLGQAGGTDLQRRTGDAVQTVCGQFINQGVDQSRADTVAQADLFDKCGEMVHTANALAGNDGATVKNLGITEEQLQGALQNVAGEEAAAAGSMATETSMSQGSAISKRMSTLLSRSSRLQLSAANMYGTDSLYVVSDTADGLVNGGSAGEGDLGEKRMSFFINGDIGGGEKDSSGGEDGFEFGSAGLTIGVDYRVNNQAVLGVAAGFNGSESEFVTSSTVAGGKLDGENVNISTYGLFFRDNFFVDGILTYGTGSYDLSRRVVIESNGTNADNNGADRTAKSSTDSTQIAMSFSGGMEFSKGSVLMAPYVRGSYLQVDVDGYEEDGAGSLDLRVESQEIESITSALGFRVSMAKSLSSSVIVPQARLEWIHEFSDDEREIKSAYVHDPRNNTLLAVTDAPDRDYFSLGVGVSSVFQNGAQAFVDIKTLLGMDDVSETVLTLGGRMEF